MLLSAFLAGGDAVAIDQGGLLLALVITIALACSAFFFWLAGRKTVCGQSPMLPGSDTDEPGAGPSLQEIEAALDTGTFTPQELKVAARLCAGMSLATIAEGIGVTKSTVGTYAKRIYAKLGVQTQAEALLALKALAEDDVKAETEVEKDNGDSPLGQSVGAVALCKAPPLICSTVLVLLTLLLQELLGELLARNGQIATAPGNSPSDSPLVLLTHLVCILAVLAVFSLYRARRTTGPEICLTALLALSLAYSSFLPGDKVTGADAFFLSGLLHTTAACCCAMCILAVAQRLTGTSRQELGVLALTTACALALRQIPGIAGALDLLALMGAVLVICLVPLDQGKTAFPFSMAPPLKSLVAMPFIGFSVYIVAYAGNVIAQQYQPAATLLPLASLAILLVAAVQAARLTAALEESIYPLVTLCMAAAFPGLLFGSVCVIGHPVGTAPLLLLAGVAVPAGYAPLARRDARLLLQRKELATKTDDEFLQRALIARGLTGSEAHVAALAAKGLPPAAIAKELTVSPNTVKTHLQHARGKLDAHRKDELTKAVAEIYRQSIDHLTAAGGAPGRD